ncbi:MAG: DNA polymerase I [Hyphomicrobiales bacterium]
MKAGDHLFLVDGSGYIFRAYHALPPLTRKSDGLPVGAVAGFCNMLWKLLREGLTPAEGDEPTHFAVIFDAKGDTFRNEIYKDYKANRPAPPEDLVPQFALIRKAVVAFGLPSVELVGYEADDLIATYTRIATAAGAEVTVISSDKDLMQLVGPTVSLFDTMKDRRIGPDEVVEKFGVPPEKVIDVQALAGDPVDNVPGVPGIGVKTAAQLIGEYGDLESLLARAGEIKQPRRRQNLIEFADQARISRRLVELDTDAPVEVDPEDFGICPVNGETLVAFLKALEFNTLTRRIAEASNLDPAAIAPADIRVDGYGGPAADPAPAAPEKATTEQAAAGRPVAASTAGAPVPEGALAPAMLVERRKDEATAGSIDTSRYETVTSLARLDEWIVEATRIGVVAVDTETTSLDAMSADLVGFSLATAPGRACYVPLGHREGADDLLGGGPVAGQIGLAEAIAALKPLLENRAVLKVGQNLKYDWLLLSRYGIEIAPFDDTMLISYVLDAGRGGNGMDELSERWLGHKPISFKEVAGTGKAQVTFDRVPLDKATEYAAEDADVTLRLWRALKPRLVAERLDTVYETLERPLVPVLARMERRGIQVDRQILSRLSGEFAQGMAALEAEIHELAGETFNIASPKQLGEILFDKFSLPGGKKTKTGAWGTGADVLETLAAEGHDLPARVLDWRQMSKLKSTYTDAIPGYVNAETRRVHTSYSLASTTTGRLSSSEPNLQNIPVRTEAGRKIRTAFVAEPGMKLISADYSQIELRVLAHIADIPQLREAFADGLDIHAMTASEMFNTPIEGMDPMVRRRAKAINFGIIYGISAFGLAAQLSISREEARAYIEKYFERFPGIRDYMEDTKRKARANGYVETIYGRRVHYPEINTKNPNMRAFLERAAINAPIQGSAADIIRRAMIRMEAALEKAGLAARMLLQVHDELIFEAPESEVDKTLPLVVRVMEEAPEPALQLAVALKVDARAADNWDEAH